MAQASSNISADRGRVNVAALGTLCALAVMQVGLVGHAVWQEARHGNTDSVGKSPGVNAAPAAFLPTVSFSPPPVGQIAAPPSVSSPAPAVVSPAPAPVVSLAPPPIGSFTAPSLPASSAVVAPPAVASLAPPPQVPVAPPTLGAVPSASSAPLPPVMPGEKIASAAPPPAFGNQAATTTNDPAAGMALQEMIELAKQVRGLGDMQGALEVLRRADLQYPARPEVLAETAQCYETMGLPDKAASLWHQIEAMDPAQASGFRDLAKRRLSSPSSADRTAPSSSFLTGAEAGKMLSLGACQANRDPSVVNGEKVVLRIPILRHGNTQVDPSQVDIDVYFFDRVNGEKVAQTIADEPVSAWAAAPVDWSGIGEEPLDVTYFLPALTPGEIAAHGRRSYHGYVVRLYYQHKLQDVAAEPRDLLDFGSRMPSETAPGGVNPLLPPVTN